MSLIAPQTFLKKKFHNLHNGAKSLPLKWLQTQEEIIFGTEIGAIIWRKDNQVKLTYFEINLSKPLFVITLQRSEKYQNRAILAILNCFFNFSLEHNFLLTSK